ncbi:MAG: hypothetical protein ACYSUI_09410, partial [Planctomycetota bacterium]
MNRGRSRHEVKHSSTPGQATLVAVIGLSALTLARIEHRTGQGTSDQAEARLYARSAIEMGLFWMNGNPEWRTGLPNGAWATKQPIGNGSFTLEGIDRVDADLANSDSDSLDLVGTGFKGDAQYKLQATLEAQGGGLTCLEVALHAGTNLVFNAALVQCNQTVSANNTVSASSSEIYATVEAGTSITGGAYGGTRNVPVPLRTMPDGTAFDYYIDPLNGTSISVASLPKSGKNYVIEDVVLSPDRNPYGVANPRGIYVIDCLGGTVLIRNCRIVGTLVLQNPNSASQ